MHVIIEQIHYKTIHTYNNSLQFSCCAALTYTMDGTVSGVSLGVYRYVLSA